MNQPLQKKSQSSVRGLFVRYTAQNILGMLGISAYVLADTFFISRAEGTAGITALNLVLPIYSLIFAIGAMLGVGSATRFAIHRARGEQEADSYLGNALVTALVVGIPFILIGLWVPDQVVAFLGGNGDFLYTDFSVVCTGIYVELHLQCLCTKRWQSFSGYGGYPLQQSV